MHHPAPVAEKLTDPCLTCMTYFELSKLVPSTLSLYKPVDTTSVPELIELGSIKTRRLADVSRNSMKLAWAPHRIMKLQS